MFVCFGVRNCRIQFPLAAQLLLLLHKEEWLCVQDELTRHTVALESNYWLRCSYLISRQPLLTVKHSGFVPSCAAISHADPLTLCTLILLSLFFPLHLHQFNLPQKPHQPWETSSLAQAGRQMSCPQALFPPATPRLSTARQLPRI